MSIPVSVILGTGEEHPFGLVSEVVAAAGGEIDWRRPAVEPYSARGWTDDEWTTICTSIRETGTALVGALSLTRASHRRSPHVELRERCECFAGLRPVKRIKGVPGRVDELDLVVIRETTEDVYAGHEHEVMTGGITTLKVVTEKASRRIAEFAFEYARSHGRKRVSIIHKANIMKQTDGLFLSTAQQVAAGYPEIECDALIVDNASMQMVLRPERYDVLLCGNMYGDILSALAAGLVGGDSALFGVAIAEDAVLFESLEHETACDIELADPLSMLLPAVHMLDHLDQAESAQRIWDAAEAVLVAGGNATPDLGGTATARQMVDAILARLAA